MNTESPRAGWPSFGSISAKLISEKKKCPFCASDQRLHQRAGSKNIKLTKATCTEMRTSAVSAESVEAARAAL